MNNPEVIKLVEDIVAEETRIMAAAESAKKEKQNAIINALVTAIREFIKEHPEKHELTLQIKPSGIIGIDSDSRYAKTIELSNIAMNLTQKDLFDNMPSVAAEFPKRYFNFFHLYKKDDLVEKLGDSFATKLLITANCALEDANLTATFSLKPVGESEETLEEITYFFVRLHYSEKADLSADQNTIPTQHTGTAFAS